MTQTATTPRFRALGHDFDVTTPDPALTDYLGGLFGDLRVGPAPAECHYEVRGPDPSGRWEVRRDGTLVEEPGTPSQALALLLWRINRGAVEDSDDLVVLHAGAVVLGDVGILLPGDVAVGKSTLVTGLLRAGADYLSDEAVGLGLADPDMHGFAKPVSLDMGSWRLFPDLEPRVPDALRPFMPAQWQVAPQAIPGVRVVTRAEPGLLVMPRFREHARSTAVRRIRGTEALLLLAECTFRSQLGRVRSLERLARLIEVTPCYELTYASLTAGVDAVVGLANAVDTTLRAAAVTPGSETAGSGTRADGRVAPRADTTLIRVDDEAVVYVEEDDEMHRLNASGATVWERLDGTHTLREVVGELARTFDVPEDVVARDVGPFVSDLLGRGLVEPTDPTER